VRTLVGAAKALGSVTTCVDTQALDVSDSTKLTATRLSGAAPGGHTIAVTQLARAEQRSFAFARAAGTLDIGGSPVTLTADDDGQAAADRINAAGTPFYAVWVKDPTGDTTKDRLFLTRKQTGVTGVPPLAVSGANLTLDRTTPALDTEYSVDDAPPLKSPTNVLTAAVPGLQLTPQGDRHDVGHRRRRSRPRCRRSSTVYNSTVDFIRGKLSEKRVANATTETDAGKGVLFGDSQLTGLLASLRNAVSDRTDLTGAIRSFGDIGVSTGAATGGQSSADALAGKLTLGLADAVAHLKVPGAGPITGSAPLDGCVEWSRDGRAKEPARMDLVDTAVGQVERGRRPRGRGRGAWDRAPGRRRGRRRAAPRQRRARARAGRSTRSARRRGPRASGRSPRLR
jgi:flagellar hook-associated protein 2